MSSPLPSRYTPWGHILKKQIGEIILEKDILIIFCDYKFYFSLFFIFISFLF
jgi:hypothetical protein